MITSISQAQICQKWGALYDPPGQNEKLGIAMATISRLPLNALRHPRENGTCGWYIWGGELSDDPQFFQSLHVNHLGSHVPVLLPYLALAAGWLVLLAWTNRRLV